MSVPTRLVFEGTATWHFHFRNSETEDMLVYQSNAVGVELFSYVNTFRWVNVTYFSHRNLVQASEVKLHISSFHLIYKQNAARLFLVEEKRVLNTQPSYSFLIVETSYTFREDKSARFLNAISTQ